MKNSALIVRDFAQKTYNHGFLFTLDDLTWRFEVDGEFVSGI
jgi:hypothetical protein